MSDDELDDFCHKNNFLGWFSTSAKTGLNVKKGMNFMIAKIIENKRAFEEQSNQNGSYYNSQDNNNTLDLNDTKNQRPKDACVCNR